MENRIGFGKRLAAYCIDAVIVWGVAIVFGSAIGGLLGAGAGVALGGGQGGPGENAAMGGALGAIFGAVVAAFVVGTVYFLVEGFTGWTFGKLLLGIQVGNADGTPADTGTLLTRYALKNISSIIGVVAFATHVGALRALGNLLGFIIFVGFFFVLGSARQGFHDMIAKTAVYPRSLVRGAA